MTSKTSLFNKGIYKNTVRRFRWGSLLYFVILFFAVPFVYLINTPLNMHRAGVADGGKIIPVLVSSSMITVPMILACAVPTVVALLVYNYVHTPRHGIFVHSLPVSRKANYVSTLLAAFTLMFVPVLAVALILLALNCFGYRLSIGFVALANWTAINIFVLALMFSVSSFAAFLTGNGFALVGINVLLQALPAVVALFMSTIGGNLLYGYSAAADSTTQFICYLAPVIWVARSVTRMGIHGLFYSGRTWAYLAFAILMYGASYVLYTKRKIESCSEVAAFDFMRPILKYSATLIVSVCTYAVCASMDINAFAIIATAVITSAIAYFSLEMLLRKTMKVFGSYKGYLGFALFAAAAMFFFACTSVFGFETRVPVAENVSSVMVDLNYSSNKPVTKEAEAIKQVIDIHSEMLKSIPRTKRLPNESFSEMNIEYRLKNGKKLARTYIADDKTIDNVMSKLFVYPDYRGCYTGMKYINIDNVKNMIMTVNAGSYSYSYSLNDESADLLRAAEKDLGNMTYDEFRSSPIVSLTFSIDMSKDDNDKLRVFNGSYDKHYYSFNLGINENYTNTMALLDKLGYTELVRTRVADEASITILKYPVESTENGYIVNGKTYTKNSDTDTKLAKDEVELSKKDAALLMQNPGVIKNTDDLKGNVYPVRINNPDYRDSYYGVHDLIYSISADDMPEYLQKYLQ